MLGLTKRTCHFIVDKNKKRSLYLALIRSNFEHCTEIWRPVTTSEVLKFEALQKKALKWIHNENNLSYPNEIYVIRCKQSNILPLHLHFDLNDILLFHKIVYHHNSVKMPEYLTQHCDENSRLRSKHLNYMSYVVNHITTSLQERSARGSMKFYKSFFHRAAQLWNKLLLEIREIRAHVKFKLAARDSLWTKIENPYGE